MDNDPYGFAHCLERDAVKAMKKANLAAFARKVRTRFDGQQERDHEYGRRRWGEVLVKVGRAGDAREHAWGEFRALPCKFTYEDLMQLVPKAERASWHAKAMDAAAGADLGSLIELWLETKEIDRLVEGQEPSDEPSFLKRAKRRWASEGVS
ncbi:MAG: hypothetical protein HY899_19655 [Deltaproteobacteria bacterium]|nr:hypothetical protein [Deltaproteobacteria bacterium]